LRLSELGLRFGSIEWSDERDNAAEDALDPMQKDLADTSDNAQMRILKKVKAAEKGASTYGKVIWIIQWTTLGVFALLALYAALRYCNQSELLL
jgi:hypothetical protein